jgi:hypothetical protein
MDSILNNNPDILSSLFIEDHNSKVDESISLSHLMNIDYDTKPKENEDCDTNSNDGFIVNIEEKEYCCQSKEDQQIDDEEEYPHELVTEEISSKISTPRKKDLTMNTNQMMEDDDQYGHVQ